MGQARNAAKAARRSALRQRLSVRRDLPRPRRWRGLGASLCRHRHDAASPRRNLAQCRRGRPRRAASRPSRMAHHGQAQHARQHHPDLPAVSCARTRSRTSGSICARTGSQTPCSKTTTRSSTPHAKPGEISSLNPKRSPPSECAIGPTSVSRYDLWYNTSRPKVSQQIPSLNRSRTAGS